MRRRFRRLGLATVTAVAGLASAGVVALPASGASAMTTVVFRSEVGPDGKIIQTQTQVPLTVLNGVRGGQKPNEPALKPAAKLDPGLVTNRGGRQQVIVTFQEDQKVPRLPDLDPKLPRNAPANAQVLKQSDAVVNDMAARRRAGYQALSDDFARMDVHTLDTYWLIKGMVVDAPMSALAALAQRGDVTYVEPVANGSRPPADSDPNNDEADARALLHTDPYFGKQNGFVGILDTGVRSTHTLFNPQRAWLLEDLTNPTNPNPNDDCWNHGTSTSAIMGGNSNLGDDFRGITSLTVDSFKVYPAGCVGLNADAAVRGFQRAVQVGDRVIVAEMQASGNETSAISAAADGAFDAGAAVIAANGNNGPNASTVNVPAVAQKVLGVGAVDVKTLATPSYQSLGPAADGRTKPDVQAPTNVETASNASDTATQVFTGTSAATPHAAGAAAVFRNGPLGIPPGGVYAMLIASGNGPTGFDSTHGGGLISLEQQGVFWETQTTVGNGQVVDIPAVDAAGPGNHRFNLAIWWPEQPATHNDIDVSLVDPNGVVRASSSSISSVFERVALTGGITAGSWKVRITGFSVTGTQQVYAAWTF
jgi:serine protease AprX